MWVEAVSGYLSASKQWANQYGESWEKFWSKEGVKAYYIHGKDNFPFHMLIWPDILPALKNLHLPDQIVSSEFLTLIVIWSFVNLLEPPYADRMTVV